MAKSSTAAAMEARPGLAGAAAVVLLVLGSLAGPSRAAEGGSICGSVHDRSDAQPLAGVEVVVLATGPSGASGDDGRFCIAGLAPGTYTLEARLSGFVVERHDQVAVTAGAATEVAFALVAVPMALEEIVVTPSRFGILRREPGTHQFLSRREVDQLPHLADDLHRAIWWLPGATGGDFSARLNIRGGRGDEVLVLLDGLEILQPYHLEGFQSVFSIVDSEAIGGVDVMTGGFPAEHGGRMSGVIDISSASASGDPRHAFGLSFVNARAISEGTFGDHERGRWLVSARRGYLDLVLDFIDADSDLRPGYWDLLGKVEYQLSDRSMVSLHLLGAGDELDYAEPGPDGEEEAAVARYGSAYAWVSWRAGWAPGAFSETVAAVGRVEGERAGRRADPGSASVHLADDRSFSFAAVKQGWSFELSDRLLLKLGGELRRLEADYDYSLRNVEEHHPLTGDRVVTDRRSRLRPSGHAYGAYLAGRWRIAAPLAAELGLRWDRQTWVDDDDQFSPRLSLLWSWGERTTVRAAWGRYYQPQGIHELQVDDGVDRFFPAELAEHRLIALEHAFPGGLDLRAELYQKVLSQQRPRWENLFDPVALFPEAELDRIRIDAARGRAEGVEIVVRRNFGERLSGWASYAWSKIEDRDASYSLSPFLQQVDAGTVPRSWDQEHASTFSVNYRRGEKWSFNLSGVYHSGWPTTELSAEPVTDPHGPDRYRPLFGPLHGERLRPYHRLDFRASRLVRLAGGSLTWFLEVTNLCNRKNTRGYGQVEIVPQPDGTVAVVREEENWLPIIPAFGVTWRFGRGP